MPCKRPAVTRGSTRLHGLLRGAALAAMAFCVGCAGLGDASSSRREVDLIVEGDYVVTVDAASRVIAGGAVAIDDGRIIAVAPADEILAGFRARDHLPGRGRVVLPGLINGHTHAAMSLLRGIADDLELLTWLEDYIFPAERNWVDAEFVRVGTELACWEMLRGGTTTFADMYYFPDAVAEAVEACGIRALVASTVIGQPAPDAASADEGLAQALDFARRWRGRSPRVLPGIAAHAVYTMSEDQLRATAEAARQADVPLQIHIAESQGELAQSRELHGATPIALLEGIGFFRGPTIGAHSVWPSDEEIGILERAGVGVVHNPSSNMKLASGVAPVTALLRAGVAVGLGTDGAASNNDLDMWEEMRMASFLQKVSSGDPTALPAQTVLRMATSGGARALGLENQIGALSVGLRADLIQVSLDDVHFLPAYDIVSHLVYVADEQDVVTTIVDGRVLVRDGELLSVDTGKVRREAEALARTIQAGLAEAADPRAAPGGR